MFWIQENSSTFIMGIVIMMIVIFLITLILRILSLRKTVEKEAQESIDEELEHVKSTHRTHDHIEKSHEHNHKNDDFHSHNHTHDGEKDGLFNIKIFLLIVSFGLFVAAFTLHVFSIAPLIVKILGVAVVCLSGYDVALSGLKSIKNKEIDETTLTTIAVIAACVLGQFIEASAVMLLYNIGEMIEDYAVNKSRKSIKALSDIREETSCICTEDKEKIVPSESVPVGSILKIYPHTRVPIDGIVVKGEGYIDTSSITGESEPSYVAEKSEILSGTFNTDKTIYIKTTKEFKDSTATRIVEIVENNAKNKGKREKTISKFASIYTPAMVITAILISVIPPLFLGDWRIWIHRALMFLVASCPCSIVISVPLSYFAGIGEASRNGIIIKGGRFIDVLSDIKTIAFDKTGTITNNTLNIVRIEPKNQAYTREAVIKCAVYAEGNSSHPIANALQAYCKENNITYCRAIENNEIAGKGVSAKIGDKLIKVEKNKKRGHSVIVLVNEEEVGEIIFSETLQKDARGSIQELKSLGITRLALFSGDNQKSVRKISHEVGIDFAYGDLLPEQKAIKVKALKPCCFVGDGINDSPAISVADCGISMGLGSELAIESSDVVLTSNSLSLLPRAIKISRQTIRIIKTNLIFSLIIKAIVIILSLASYPPLWLAVIADTGTCVLCILHSLLFLKINSTKRKREHK